MLAGLAIGVINVTVSASSAVFATRDPGTMRDLVRYVDPNPLRQPVVLVAVAAVLAGAAVMATFGSGVARMPRLRWLAMTGLVIVVPIFHLIATIGLVKGGLGPLGDLDTAS